MQAATRRQRSTTSPASQRRTRTSKPYLCVGVMEREKWSLRDGEESIRGQNTPPSGASSPADPHRHPRYPKSAQGGGPRPIQTRAHGSPGRPTRPTAEEKLPHPIIQSVPKLHKTIRHPGKARLPRLYWTPPPAEAPMHRRPPPEPGPSACTNPCSRRHTNQDPSPPGPAVTPTRRQSAPRSPNPPRTNPGTVRPPGWQPTSAGTGIPSSAACRRARNSIQESPIPHPGQGRSPSAEPPRNPSPGNPRCPRPILKSPVQTVAIILEAHNFLEYHYVL